MHVCMNHFSCSVLAYPLVLATQLSGLGKAHRVGIEVESKDYQKFKKNGRDFTLFGQVSGTLSMEEVFLLCQTRRTDLPPQIATTIAYNDFFPLNLLCIIVTCPFFLITLSFYSTFIHSWYIYLYIYVNIAWYSLV